MPRARRQKSGNPPSPFSPRRTVFSTADEPWGVFVNVRGPNYEHGPLAKLNAGNTTAQDADGIWKTLNCMTLEQVSAASDAGQLANLELWTGKKFGYTPYVKCTVDDRRHGYDRHPMLGVMVETEDDMKALTTQLEAQGLMDYWGQIVDVHAQFVKKKAADKRKADAAEERKRAIDVGLLVDQVKKQATAKGQTPKEYLDWLEAAKPAPSVVTVSGGPSTTQTSASHTPGTDAPGVMAGLPGTSPSALMGGGSQAWATPPARLGGMVVPPQPQVPSPPANLGGPGLSQPPNIPPVVQARFRWLINYGLTPEAAVQQLKNEGFM